MVGVGTTVLPLHLSEAVVARVAGGTMQTVIGRAGVAGFPAVIWPTRRAKVCGERGDDITASRSPRSSSRRPPKRCKLAHARRRRHSPSRAACKTSRRSTACSARQSWTNLRCPMLNAAPFASTCFRRSWTSSGRRSRPKISWRPPTRWQTSSTCWRAQCTSWAWGLASRRYARRA